MRYDLIDLRLFMHVGETHNLTRAAEKTFLSLPAASARIKNIEDALKVKLLTRHATGVQMTPAGEILLKYARRIFVELDHLSTDLQPYANGIKGRLRLLANTSATNTFLADTLSLFLAAHQEVDIELEERDSKDIMQALRTGTADLGIVAGNFEFDGLDAYPLFQDELIVITSKNHPLADHSQVQFSDIVGQYSFVGIHIKSVIQGFLQDIATGLGYRLNHRVYMGSYDAACRMVEAGVGIAVIPKACALRYRGAEQLHQVSLSDPWAVRRRFVCRQKDRSLPAFAEDFIRLLIQTTSPIDAK